MSFEDKKKALLFIKGEVPAFFPDFAAYGLVGCTDGAYAYLQNRPLDFISGDFDSLPIGQNMPTHIERIHTPDQNKTDFEKALEIIENQGFTKVDVFGASGKEQDHFLGNLSTAMRFSARLELTFFDQFHRYFICPNHFKFNTEKGKIISLIPMPRAENIHTQGLAYPLRGETLVFGTRIGTRNRSIAQEVQLQYSGGTLWIFIEH